MAGAEEVPEHPAGQIGRGPLLLDGLLEEPQGGQGLPMHPLGVEDSGQLAGQCFDFCGLPAVEERSIPAASVLRDSAGGSYRAALANTFVPELLSMNFLMAGMVPTVMTLKAHIPAAAEL